MSHPGNLPPARCLWDGCESLEELASGRSAGGLCSLHRYRKRMGLPMDAPRNNGKAHHLTRRQALKEAALAFADAEGPEEYRRAEWRLLQAAYRIRQRRR